MRRPRRSRQIPIDVGRILPPTGSGSRWGARAKAAVVIAVRSGILSASDAYERCHLSVEELGRWEDAFDSDGIAGLRAKSLAGRVVSRGHQSDQ